MTYSMGRVVRLSQDKKYRTSGPVHLSAVPANIAPAMHVICPTEVKRGFGRRIRVLRFACGFRYVRGFAEHVGIPENTMQKYEQGNRVPPLPSRELQLIGQATGATVDWLCYGRIDTLPTDLRIKILKQEARHAGGK